LDSDPKSLDVWSQSRSLKFEFQFRSPGFHCVITATVRLVSLCTKSTKRQSHFFSKEFFALKRMHTKMLH